MASYDKIVDPEIKKHGGKRVTYTKSNQDAISIPVYCRRHASKSKHTIKTRLNAHKDHPDHSTNNAMTDYDCETSLKHGSSKYEHETKRRLSEESTSYSQAAGEGRRRSKQISKDKLRIAKEYHKLEKHYKCVQEECQRLSSLLEHRELEYRKVCSHYQALIQMVQELEDAKVTLNKQNHKLETEKTQSEEDIGLLKSIVCQLNTELERYQDKLRDQKYGNISANIENNEGKHDDRIWNGINFHALGPLLNAYQENLSEKRNLVHMYEQEMADFGSRCKEIVTENELMHKEVEDLRSECNRYEKEIKTLVANTASLKKQNDVFKKEAIEVKKHASEIHSDYELKMEIILKRNEMLKKEHASAMTELSNLRGKYEILSKEFNQMKSKSEQSVPTIIHTAAIEECKTLLDELRYQYENERRNLRNHIKRIEENQPETDKQLIMVTAERNHLKKLVGTLQTNLKRTQRKIERMQSVVYSTRLSHNSLKGQLSKATAYCGELFAEYERIIAEREKLLTLLRETEKENANMDRVGKNISGRMEDLKNQLEIVQNGAKLHVDSVEKRIKLQELQVRRMKRDYRSRIQQLSEIIKQKENIIEKLETDKHPSQNNVSRQISDSSLKDEKAKKIRDL